MSERTQKQIEEEDRFFTVESALRTANWDVNADFAAIGMRHWLHDFTEGMREGAISFLQRRGIPFTDPRDTNGYKPIPEAEFHAANEQPFKNHTTGIYTTKEPKNV